VYEIMVHFMGQVSVHLLNPAVLNNCIFCHVVINKIDHQKCCWLRVGG
jgi:hypothetical protein